jgi:hypothetical protein
MLDELPAVATLVMFNVQASSAAAEAVRSVQCSPRVVSVPVVAGTASGPLTPAQLRSIAPAFALATSRDLPLMGDFVVSCSRCASSNGTSSRLFAFMEISVVVRSKQVGEFKQASVVVAARVDLSRFVASAIERTGFCGNSCSMSLVVASGIHAGLVLATTAVLPSHAPSSPTIFDVEGAVFEQAWNAILAAPSGSINISGRQDASAPSPFYICVTSPAAFGSTISQGRTVASSATLLLIQLGRTLRIARLCLALFTVKSRGGQHRKCREQRAARKCREQRAASWLPFSLAKRTRQLSLQIHPKQPPRARPRRSSPSPLFQCAAECSRLLC